MSDFDKYKLPKEAAGHNQPKDIYRFMQLLLGRRDGFNSKTGKKEDNFLIEKGPPTPLMTWKAVVITRSIIPGTRRVGKFRTIEVCNLFRQLALAYSVSPEDSLWTRAWMKAYFIVENIGRPIPVTQHRDIVQKFHFSPGLMNLAKQKCIKKFSEYNEPIDTNIKSALLMGFDMRNISTNHSIIKGRLKKRAAANNLANLWISEVPILVPPDIARRHFIHIRKWSSDSNYNTSYIILYCAISHALIIRNGNNRDSQIHGEWVGKTVAAMQAAIIAPGTSESFLKKWFNRLMSLFSIAISSFKVLGGPIAGSVIAGVQLVINEFNLIKENDPQKYHKIAAKLDDIVDAVAKEIIQDRSKFQEYLNFRRNALSDTRNEWGLLTYS